MLYELDPVRDPRWKDLLCRHPESSVFHSPGWLEALRRTYRYEPVAFTDVAPGERLGNALLCCRVDSWLTGRRLVSLPFSDHCEPLVENGERLAGLLEALADRMREEGRTIELRPRRRTGLPGPYREAERYCLHSIDLEPPVEDVFAGLHKSHVRRSIGKAERAGMTSEAGRSDRLLREFYGLHAMTRRRQGVPVQPFAWFRNLVGCVGEDLTIRLASLDGKPAAAILTVVYRTSLVYKYGCSNPAFNRFGATSWLFWLAIQEAKRDGMREFDLGRSDLDNEGLIAFKDHLGGRRSVLCYYQSGPPKLGSSADRWHALAARVYARSPRTVQTIVGRGLYRHFG